MPVATSEGFVEKPEKSRPSGNRPRRKSSSVLTVVASEGETSRMAAAGYHTESQQAAPASYLPRHSPILNLSPNLSPESQPDSSGSPVF